MQGRRLASLPTGRDHAHRRVHPERAVPRAEVGCELGSNILSRLCEGAAFLSSQESFFEVLSNLLFTALADDCRNIAISFIDL
jgi:hypothetical protein